MTSATTSSHKGINTDATNISSKSINNDNDSIKTTTPLTSSHLVGDVATTTTATTATPTTTPTTTVMMNVMATGESVSERNGLAAPVHRSNSASLSQSENATTVNKTAGSDSRANSASDTSKSINNHFDAVIENSSAMTIPNTDALTLAVDTSTKVNSDRVDTANPMLSNAKLLSPNIRVEILSKNDAIETQSTSNEQDIARKVRRSVFYRFQSSPVFHVPYQCRIHIHTRTHTDCPHFHISINVFP